MCVAGGQNLRIRFCAHRHRCDASPHKTTTLLTYLAVAQAAGDALNGWYLGRKLRWRGCNRSATERRGAVLECSGVAQQATVGLPWAQVCLAAPVCVGGSTRPHLRQHAQPYWAVRAGQGTCRHIRGKAAAAHGQPLRMHAAAIQLGAGGQGASDGHL